MKKRFRFKSGNFLQKFEKRSMRDQLHLLIKKL
jgi:hypothetical protein